MEGSLEQVHCKHFVTRKKRFCKMSLKKGEEYCGEHQPHQSGVLNDEKGVGNLPNNKKARISCPLDPKHTCYVNKLKQHLKKCNAKPTTLPLYIQRNVNCMNNSEDVIREKRVLANVAVADLLQVIEKVNKVHNDVMKDEIMEKFLSHSILDLELSNPEYGESKKKHLIQTSSIIGLMQEHHLLKPDTCYIEFGAGKGKLSYWVTKTLESLEDHSSSVLLVERASHRHKQDNKLNKSASNIERIRADIADLVLSKVDAVKKAKSVVGLTKHLCGEATDLALHCLMNCKADKKDVSGVIMAFCCHHRCQWSTFTGKKFFEEHGLLQHDFDAMCGLVSWAVCGTGQSREHRQNKESLPNQNARDIEIGLNREEKAEIGRKCKNLLNWGRLQFLIEHSFNCTLCYYVDASISLENVCIIGVKDST